MTILIFLTILIFASLFFFEYLLTDMKLHRKDTVVKYFERQKESIHDKYQAIAFVL